MKHASVGTVSHGTLRTEDLLATFASELEYHVQRTEEWCSDDGRQRRNSHIQLIWLAREFSEDDDETGGSIVDDLIEHLQEFAPPYCYFGTAEGDGSDFGFWPCMDQIKELPPIENGDDAKELGGGLRVRKRPRQCHCVRR